MAGEDSYEPLRSNVPTNKAFAATTGSFVGGPTAVLVLYILQLLGLTLPENVQVAVTAIITGLLTGSAAYLTPPGHDQTVVVENGKPRTGVIARRVRGT